MSTVLSPELVRLVETRAKGVDKQEIDARYALPLLGEAGLISADYQRSANAIRELAQLDMSVAFTLWSSRMTYEYLQRAGFSAWAKEVAAGRPGVSGMASSFQSAAGLGELELSAEKADGGFIVNGRLGWATNLYDDAIVVTGAGTSAGQRFLFTFEAGHEGVTFGQRFGLLGLNATASTSVTFENVFIPDEQVLTTDFPSFLPGCRPVLVLMQTSECLGVAQAAAEAARPKMTGMKEVFSADLDAVEADIARGVDKQRELISLLQAGEKINPVELISLRFNAADAAGRATNIEVRVAGGAGYASSSPTSRRYREATFLPVQSPTEAQLRYELAARK